MIAFDELKSIASVLQEAGKVEQYRQILDAQKELLEMQNKIAELESENRQLKERLSEKGELVYKNQSYWRKKENSEDGPFCSRCWDKDKNLVRVKPRANPAYFVCPDCKNDFEVYPEKDTSSHDIGPVNTGQC